MSDESEKPDTFDEYFDRRNKAALTPYEFPKLLLEWEKNANPQIGDLVIHFQTPEEVQARWETEQHEKHCPYLGPTYAFYLLKKWPVTTWNPHGRTLDCIGSEGGSDFYFDHPPERRMCSVLKREAIIPPRYANIAAIRSRCKQGEGYLWFNGANAAEIIHDFVSPPPPGMFVAPPPPSAEQTSLF